MQLFSTEQVSKYHPDKYADQISDAILNECLAQDKHSHCGIETLVKDNTVVLGGEITTNAKIDYNAIVKRVAAKLNYQVDNIINLIGEQSQEINEAVVDDPNIGAGDQGIMFGYATNENEQYLPLGFYYANKIIHEIESYVAAGNSKLKGDAKTQVTIDLETNQVHQVLVSVCHNSSVPLENVQDIVWELIQKAQVPVTREQCIINPSGTWTIGGPTADCGLTGRKIVCDQYGGYCAVGGGAFSGKDPSKVDRSATYMARIIAVDLVKTFGLKNCMVQLAYAIGMSQPMSVGITAPGLCKSSHDVILEYINKKYDLTPKGIIEKLELYDVNYEYLAEGNHMGKIAHMYE